MVRVHFLNVGHGDCTLIEHASGNFTMIDINNGEELDAETATEVAEEIGYDPMVLNKYVTELGYTPNQILLANGYNRKTSNPVKYFKDNFAGQNIFRYIQTHPDMDHMRGLASLHSEGIKIVNFWDTDHIKEIEDFIGEADKEDWEHYQKTRKGELPDTTILKYSHGAKNQYFNFHPVNQDEGDGLYILAPTPELTKQSNETENWNNHSYVLMLKYKGIKVIFGGDAGSAVWDAVIQNYANDLKCNILKASHHGRDSGFHEEAVKLMNPDYTIVSVGKKPNTDASNKYKKHTSQEVWSTRWKGNIVLEIDDNGNAVINSQY